MSTTSAAITVKLLAKEVLEAAEALAANNQQQRTLTTGLQSWVAELDADSTPKLDQPVVAHQITLTTSVVTTIDLTAVQALVLPTGVARLVDLTGAKLKAFFLRAGNDNDAAGVTIEPGSSNPYPIFGTGNTIVLGPGRIEAGGFDGIESDLAAVAGGAKEIDISGTTGDTLYFELLFGT